MSVPWNRKRPNGSLKPQPRYLTVPARHNNQAHNDRKQRERASQRGLPMPRRPADVAQPVSLEDFAHVNWERFPSVHAVPVLFSLSNSRTTSVLLDWSAPTVKGPRCLRFAFQSRVEKHKPRREGLRFRRDRYGAAPLAGAAVLMSSLTA